MTSKELYKRSAKGEILVWKISKLRDGSLRISHGLYGGSQIFEDIQPTKVKVDEYYSRVKAKRKEGYKELTDLYDNAPETLPKEHLLEYLKRYLPKYNTTSEGFVLPMLAKTLEDNKPFEKNGSMLAQWKINGLRCIIGAEKSKYDLFNTTRFTYTSREGTRWSLGWMDELLLLNLDKTLIDFMVNDGVCLDGELYLPGYSVNEINSFVKNPSMLQHFMLQYWCYDLCMENADANTRKAWIDKYIDVHNVHARITTKEAHLNNKTQLVVLPSYTTDNIVEARKLRDYFINLGFEGAIFRNPKADYAFGKRNSSMFKYKKKEDGYFEIIGINADKRGLPIYTLKNDINNELFECTINLPQDKQREQLLMADKLIGKKGLVEYRERSGIKQVPFHAKLINIVI